MELQLSPLLKQQAMIDEGVYWRWNACPLA